MNQLATASGELDVEALSALVEKLIRTGDTRRLKVVRDQLKAAVDRRMASQRQSKYMEDPGLWVQERLGQVAWSKQREILNSVRDHRRTAVRSCHGIGKALSLSTALPTPDGWTTMGAVQDGDYLLDENGQPVKVLGVSPVQYRDTFEVAFDDGTVITASGDHLWQVLDLRVRHAFRQRLRGRGEVAPSDWREQWELSETRTTRELAESLRTTAGTKGGQLRWAVPTTKPLTGEAVTLPIPAYTLGAWLGDGDTAEPRITVSHEDADHLAAQLHADGVEFREIASRRRDTTTAYVMPNGMRARFRAAGLLGHKHVPAPYLRADQAARLALLAGIMDTDGFVQSNGAVAQIDITSKLIADAVAEISASFGWKVRRTTKRATYYGKDCGIVYRVSFRPDRQVFRLPRKAAKLKVEGGSQASRRTIRTITGVRPVPAVPVKCVKVDSPTSLYLAGEGFVPTHNSHTASLAISWWLDSHPPGSAFVVTTAPTTAQVRAILWRYVRRMHKSGGLPGRVNQTEWLIDEELVAFGRKPADQDESAFQGIHERYVLVVYDEACHDDQTEVMTESGWRKFASLDGTERLLTMDPQTHRAVYRLPEKIVAKPYSGPMYLYEAKGANYCVTPDHDMYFHGRNGRSQDTAWRKEPMSGLAAKSNKYMKKAVDWDVADVETYTIPAFQSDRKFFPELTVPMDDWLEFLGWYCSEGNLLKRRGREYGVMIGQKDPEVRARIHKLCVRLGLPAKLYDSGIQIHVHSRQLGVHLAELGPNCLNKRIPMYARMVSARQMNIFLDAFAEGDGYRKGNGEIIYTSSPAMADDLQEMILKTGMPSVVRKRSIAGQVKDLGTHTATSTVDGYVVTRPHKASEIKHFPENVREVDYDGMVYCASIPPESLLFTRRKGYTLWSGNCGIPEQLWVAGDALATGPDCRQLAIGNPDNSATHFFKVCQPGSGWHSMGISAFDSPNFTGERVPEQVAASLVSKIWVDEKKVDWGEDNPLYRSKVLGEFSVDSVDTVVRASDVAACRIDPEVKYSPVDLSPVELGVDVGGGHDETVIRERRGRLAGREWRIRTDRPEKIAPLVLRALRESGATAVKIDQIGVGFGVIGELRNLASRKEHRARIIGVNVSTAARDKKKFVNLRAEMWWTIGREFSTSGAWDLSKMENADTVAAQLLQPRWFLDSKGRIQVELKADIIKRTGRSPDNADALLLAYYNGTTPRLRVLP